MTVRAAVWIALATAVAAPSWAQVPPSPSQGPPVVVARGEAELRVVPDQAFVGVGAEQTAKTPKEAQALAAKAMTSVQQRLLAAGIPKDAVRTTAYDVQAQFDFVNGKQVPRGYLARHAVEVRVDDVTRVGEVLELAIGAGGTSVQGVRFDVKQRAVLERDALTKAVAEARARATAMAAGAGTTVDTVLRIEELGVGGGPEPMMAMRTAALAADAPPPVAPGEMIIRASVTLTARLK